MTPVDSSAIQAIGYDEAGKTARVQFKSGRIYEYTGIEPEHFEAFRTADSIGAHFNTTFPRGAYTEVT